MYEKTSLLLLQYIQFFSELRPLKALYQAGPGTRHTKRGGGEKEKREGLLVRVQSLEGRYFYGNSSSGRHMRSPLGLNKGLEKLVGKGRGGGLE